MTPEPREIITVRNGSKFYCGTLIKRLPRGQAQIRIDGPLQAVQGYEIPKQ